MMRPPPPLLALAAGLAQSVLVRRGRRTGRVRASAAATTAVASGAFAAAAASQFRRQGTTLEPFDPSAASSLVTTGVNSVSRNPMYVGLSGLLVANALRLGSWTALLPATAFMLVIDHFQVRAEESALLEKFGSDYAAYCERVPRWLGR